MPITHHQTKVACELLGELNVAFIYTGGSNPDITVTEAWVEVPESGTVCALNEALTRTPYSRIALVDLDKRLFPALRLSLWDDLIDQAQRDLDPSMNDMCLAAE